MLKSLNRYLCCPICRGNLDLTVFVEDKGRVQEGALTCPSCHIIYPVTGWIPRFVPGYLRHEPEFWARHDLPLDRMLRSWPDEHTEVASIQTQTQSNFGHEWDYYANLGWTDTTGVDASNNAESQQWFHEKTLLDATDIQGRVILDAGCGNGRFSRVALDAGATVISLDLTSAADVAFNNLQQCGKIPMVVQGDILHLPFRPEAFEAVFTIGVIQHTGKPLEATARLAELVRPGGLLSVRTYRLGNPRLEENDTAIRNLTTTFSLEELHEFSDILAQLTKFLIRKNLYSQVARHINLFPKRYDIFDWYSAPVAAKLTYAEMRATFTQSGLEVVRDADDNSSPEQRSFSAISIVGRRPLRKQ